MANQPYRSHTNPIFLFLNLLKVADIYKYQLGIYMWKNEVNFEQNFRKNLHNTRSGDHYVPSRQRLTRAFNQSIMYQAPHNWQNIPATIINSPSLSSFKRNFKSHLIPLYQNADV